MLPEVEIMRAVNGHNVTETIEALLDSGLVFHNLSHMVRKWGKLATWITKYRMLENQVRHGYAYQLTFEDDVVVQPSFRRFLEIACLRYERWRPDIMLLAEFGEVLLTSLAGARCLLRQMRIFGIRKNDDQQLGDGRQLRIAATRYAPYIGNPNPRKMPFLLGRSTNNGDISASPGMTWDEMALLRLVTNPGARMLLHFGNPPNLPKLRRDRIVKDRDRILSATEEGGADVAPTNVDTSIGAGERAVLRARKRAAARARHAAKVSALPLAAVRMKGDYRAVER